MGHLGLLPQSVRGKFRFKGQSKNEKNKILRESKLLEKLGVFAIVLECVEIGIGRVWFQPGAESQKAIELCEDNGIQVIYNACAMGEKGLIS